MSDNTTPEPEIAGDASEEEVAVSELIGRLIAFLMVKTAVERLAIAAAASNGHIEKEVADILSDSLLVTTEGLDMLRSILSGEDAEEDQ